MLAASKICSKITITLKSNIGIFLLPNRKRNSPLPILKQPIHPGRNWKGALHSTFSIPTDNYSLIFVPARTKVFQFNLFSLNRKFLATYSKPFCLNLLVNSHILYERMHSIYRREGGNRDGMTNQQGLEDTSIACWKDVNTIYATE